MLWLTLQRGEIPTPTGIFISFTVYFQSLDPTAYVGRREALIYSIHTGSHMHQLNMRGTLINIRESLCSFFPQYVKSAIRETMIPLCSEYNRCPPTQHAQIVNTFFFLEFTGRCRSQTRGRDATEDGASERSGCSQSQLRKTGEDACVGTTCGRTQNHSQQRKCDVLRPHYPCNTSNVLQNTMAHYLNRELHVFRSSYQKLRWRARGSSDMGWFQSCWRSQTASEKNSTTSDVWHRSKRRRGARSTVNSSELRCNTHTYTV